MVALFLVTTPPALVGQPLTPAGEIQRGFCFVRQDGKT